MTELLRFSKEDIAVHQDTVKPWADHTAAHSGGRYEGDYLIDKARKGDVQFWAVVEAKNIKALFVTEIVIFPKMREFRVLTLTGVNMKSWVDIINKLEAFAKAQGCVRIGMMARPGWEKIGRDYKYSKTHVHLEKDL